jgi:hypothetical protein
MRSCLLAIPVPWPPFRGRLPRRQSHRSTAISSSSSSLTITATSGYPARSPLFDAPVRPRSANANSTSCSAIRVPAQMRTRLPDARRTIWTDCCGSLRKFSFLAYQCTDQCRRIYFVYITVVLWRFRARITSQPEFVLPLVLLVSAVAAAHRCSNADDPTDRLMLALARATSAALAPLADWRRARRKARSSVSDHDSTAPLGWSMVGGLDAQLTPLEILLPPLLLTRLLLILLLLVLVAISLGLLVAVLLLLLLCAELIGSLLRSLDATFDVELESDFLFRDGFPSATGVVFVLDDVEIAEASRRVDSADEDVWALPVPGEGEGPLRRRLAPRGIKSIRKVVYALRDNPKISLGDTAHATYADFAAGSRAADAALARTSRRSSMDLTSGLS